MYVSSDRKGLWLTCANCYLQICTITPGTELDDLNRAGGFHDCWKDRDK